MAAYPVFERSLLEYTYFGCFRYDYHIDKKSGYLHFLLNADEPMSPIAKPAKRKDDLRKRDGRFEFKRLNGECGWGS